MRSSAEGVTNSAPKALALIRGLPGHPLHPPLTDATIGMYVLAGGLAVIGYAGGIEPAAAKAKWLALIGGLPVPIVVAHGLVAATTLVLVLLAGGLTVMKTHHTDTTGSPGDPSRWIQWRARRLLGARFQRELADRLAREARIDVHALLELVDRGCPPELAARILAPL
jgi:hypothetical protein